MGHCLYVLNSKIQHKDFDLRVSGGWASGQTIGTRIAQVHVDPEISSQQYIVGIAFMYIGDSSSYIPFAFYSGGLLYCNYYAAKANAVSESGTSVKVRVSYRND